MNSSGKIDVTLREKRHNIIIIIKKKTDNEQVFAWWPHAGCRMSDECINPVGVIIRSVVRMSIDQHFIDNNGSIEHQLQLFRSLNYNVVRRYITENIIVVI